MLKLKIYRQIRPIQFFSCMYCLFLVFNQRALAADDVPASGSPHTWLTLSGEIREKSIYVSNIEYDPDNGDNGLKWGQRLSLTADSKISSILRNRITFISATQKDESTSPADRNLLDFQELHFDLGTETNFFRVGRQELSLGSSRIIGTRNGTNVKRTFDGIRGLFKTNRWSINSFSLREVKVEQTGAFNDEANKGRKLAGIYSTLDLGHSGLDLYYIYSALDDRISVENDGTQRRNSIGLRSFGEISNLFWNWEAIYQTGKQKDVDISAWTLATNTGYIFRGAHWTPKLMLSTNIASGDEKAGDGRLGTFDAIFPRGNYFSQLALLGPSNFFNLHPSISASPQDGMNIFFDINFYWRYDTDDGIYSPSGRMLRDGNTSDDRYVSTSVSSGIEWQITQPLSLSILLTRAEPGAFIESSGPSRPIDFFEFTLGYKL